MGISQIALILGVAGLVVGVSGVALALTHAGPAGPTGATGATGAKGDSGSQGPPGTQGPAGPGATVKQGYNVGTTLMSSTCKYYQGSNLSFTVSTPGTFVVTASLVLFGSHTTGYTTTLITSLANTSAACSPTSNNFVVTEEASGAASMGYEFDVSLVQSFVVSAAGTYTFGVIGTASGGGSGDFCDFYYASVVGVFYPS